MVVALALGGCGKPSSPASSAAAVDSTSADQWTSTALAAVDGVRIVAADDEPEAWMAHGRTYSEQRFSPLASINDGNVGQLGLAWAYKLDVDRATEATPIVVDGVMYVTGAYSIVSALNPVTGQELWKYDPKVPRDFDRHGC